MPGELALPEALEILGLEEGGEDDTIGGHVVALLKRLPSSGDELRLGPYRVTVEGVRDRRIETLRFRLEEDETS
jgi:CBS domain containing-hemolysin-like protein